MKISIIIPSYNRGYIISRTLDSIISQTYREWECLLVDDFSSDNTEIIVNEYQKRDPRIKYLKNERSKGAQGARNTGILRSIGEWVVLFDSDNVMLPDFLQKCIGALENNKIDIVTTWSNVIDSNTQKRIRGFEWINNGYIYNGLLSAKCYVDNSCTIIRKNKLKDIGLLAEDCPAFQEWDTHLRLSQICTYMTIEEYLIDYYFGAIDSISSDSVKDVKGYLYILNKFKYDWICYSKFNYWKYLAILGCKISLLDKDKKEIYQASYIELVGRYKPVVFFLTKILSIKQRLKDSIKREKNETL